MTLTKNKMIRKIGQRTRLRNRDVQMMLEALVEVWAEELINGGRIEMENFLVIEVQNIDRGENTGELKQSNPAPRHIKKVTVRASKLLRVLLRSSET
ncbi:MAG: HU family DNA-binding protein [Anaerolineae bacterium]|nr:HU family DNA-binding protein [Anaerolineae bacterium]